MEFGGLELLSEVILEFRAQMCIEIPMPLEVVGLWGNWEAKDPVGSMSYTPLTVPLTMQWKHMGKYIS